MVPEIMLYLLGVWIVVHVIRIGWTYEWWRKTGQPMTPESVLRRRKWVLNFEFAALWFFIVLLVMFRFVRFDFQEFSLNELVVPVICAGVSSGIMFLYALFNTFMNKRRRRRLESLAEKLSEQDKE